MSESDIEKELALLKRRWGSSMEVLGVQYEGDVGAAACFTISLPPTDPDFSHDIGGFLKMTITLPAGYPQSKPCEVVINNENLNQQVRHAIGKAIAAEATNLVGKIMVRDVLKFIDNNLAMLVDCALEVVSTGKASAAPAPAPAPKREQPADQAASDSKVWSAEQQKCLEAALKEFPASMEVGERWKSIASRVPGKTKRECVERFKELNQILKQQQQQQQQQSAPAELKYAENAAGTLRAEGAARNSMVPLPDAPYPLQQGKGAEQHTMCTFLQQQAKAPTAAGPAAPVLAAGGVREGGWSEEEAAALQAALNEFAEASMGKQERWRRIAIRVPSKSIKQCYDKVREMRAALQRGLDQQLKAGAASKSASAKPKSALVKFSLDSAREGAGGEQVEEEADSDEPISGDDDDDEEEEGEESEGEGDEGEKSHIRPLEEMDASGRVSLTGHHRGTQLKLNDLLLQGVSVAQFAAARVQCACNRCSLKFDVLLARGKELEEDCPRCRMARTVRLRSDVLHANNHSAGYVDTEGCTVLDLLPSDLWLACDACGAETCHRRLQRGKRSEEVCRGCYAKLSVGFGQVGIVRLDAARTDAGANGAKRNKGGQQSKERELVVGTPLPNRGTCDHYKRSTRWLRFPCCGKMYPCDICHEKAESGCTPGTWATRMICGLCSLEQAYSNKDCKCGASFGSGASKTHWEGGAGCRDRIKMSNKDSKKHAGTAKTISRKAMATLKK